MLQSGAAGLTNSIASVRRQIGLALELFRQRPDRRNDLIEQGPIGLGVGRIARVRPAFEQIGQTRSLQPRKHAPQDISSRAQRGTARRYRMSTLVFEISTPSAEPLLPGGGEKFTPRFSRGSQAEIFLKANSREAPLGAPRNGAGLILISSLKGKKHRCTIYAQSELSN